MIEIEAKFIINHDKIRTRLKELGAELITPQRQMTRQNADTPKGVDNGEWVRVRDEGQGVITMSYKRLGDRSLSGTKEICLNVDDFGKAVAFLEACGMKMRNIQQTRRETWQLFDAEIDLDEWPWIPEFIEIEAESETIVRQVAEALDLDMADAIYGSVEPVYMKYYDVTEEEVDNWPEILFGPVPEWLEAKRRHST